MQWKYFSIIILQLRTKLVFLKIINLFQINQATHDQAVVLQTALQSIPNPTSECMLRNVAIRLAQQISDEVSSTVFAIFLKPSTSSLICKTCSSM